MFFYAILILVITLREFFLNLNNTSSITLFSIPHILMISITFILAFIIIYKRYKISKIPPKLYNIMRILFGIVLVLNFILRRGSFIYYNVYNWRIHLDINFCNFTSIMTIIYCFTNNKKILNICYHMAFIGPLIAIILPSYNLMPYGYAFYSFLILHNGVFLFILFSIFANKLEWSKERRFQTIKFLIIYYVIIFTFDYFFKVNYNMPLSFVNVSITNIPFINFLANNNVIVFCIYFIIIFALTYLGNYSLKFFSQKINL